MKIAGFGLAEHGIGVGVGFSVGWGDKEEDAG
jgi:hypothetical protein